MLAPKPKFKKYKLKKQMTDGQKHLDKKFSAGPEIYVSKNKGMFLESYKLLNKIGAGASGIVTKVMHKRTGMIRAVKTLRKSQVEKAGTTTPIFRELTILEKIDHPHILKIFELFDDDQNYYLVTE